MKPEIGVCSEMTNTIISLIQQVEALKIGILQREAVIREAIERLRPTDCTGLVDRLEACLPLESEK